MRLDATPFVLIDADAGARLYRAPLRVLSATAEHEVAPLIEALRGAGEVAGFLAYEAGAAIAPRPVPTLAPPLPLAWFGVFEACEPVADVAALLPDPAGAWVGKPGPGIKRAVYDAAFARVKALIEAGDLYQANLSFRASVRVLGDPLALYAAVRARARAGNGALVWTGADWLLSFSPESFFRVEGRTVTARPMKGTARRGDTPEADRAAAAALAADPKQRAENLMIVDLIRNDLSRVAAPGSVAVPELFTVETYPSVHQLTSTVTATLADGRDAVDLLLAAFPCGSITGAPKQRATEVIAAVETSARGAYTGSIGWIGADGDAAFSVAIRTLHLRAGEEVATLGLGSGVVADSGAGEEWDECLAKGAFLTQGQRAVDLIETMAFDPEAGLHHLHRHLGRLSASAEAFGIRFDRHAARNKLQATTFWLRAPAKVRLVVGARGGMAVEVSPMPEAQDAPVAVRVVPLPVDPADWRLRHKTSDRRFYDRARAASGCWEVAFARPDGLLTEGSFTSLFVPRGDLLVTPPLALGLLPGVLRAELIDSGRAVEGELTEVDLAGAFYVGNALRGLVPAFLAAAQQSRL